MSMKLIYKFAKILFWIGFTFFIICWLYNPVRVQESPLGEVKNISRIQIGTREYVILQVGGHSKGNLRNYEVKEQSGVLHVSIMREILPFVFFGGSDLCVINIISDADKFVQYQDYNLKTHRLKIPEKVQVIPSEPMVDR